MWKPIITLSKGLPAIAGTLKNIALVLPLLSLFNRDAPKNTTAIEADTDGYHKKETPGRVMCLSESDKDQIALYYKNGSSLRVLANMFFVSKRTIGRCLEERGILRNPQNHSRRKHGSNSQNKTNNK